MSRILYTSRDLTYKKRRRGVWWKLAAGGTIFALILTGLVFSLRFSEWQIRSIKFSGVIVLDEQELEEKIRGELDGNFLFFIPRSSFFAASAAAVENALAKDFARIKDVSVDRKFPDTLLVSVVEREFRAILCNDPGCVYVDAQGYAMDKAPQSTGSLVTKIKTDFSDISPGRQVLEEALAERLFLLGEKVERGIDSRVIGYEYSSVLPREVRVLTDESFALLVSLESDFDEVIKVLKTVLSEEVKEKRSRLDYLDLRFGNKVFFKFED